MRRIEPEMGLGGLMKVGQTINENESLFGYTDGCVGDM